jgi:hypothetical protein
MVRHNVAMRSYTCLPGADGCIVSPDGVDAPLESTPRPLENKVKDVPRQARHSPWCTRAEPSQSPLRACVMGRNGTTSN